VKSELLSYLPERSVVVDFITSTEAGMGISIATKAQPVETGRFTPNPGVLVLDDDDVPIPPGAPEAGRIAVPSNAYGYLGDEGKTATTFPVINGQRYAIPGDYALHEADGSMRFLGRGATCINTGGLKVYTDEVEDVLKSHPRVLDALVLGTPDERLGQQVAALLSLDIEADGATNGELEVTEILDFARTRLAGFKIPRRVHVVAAVPRNNVGKVDYNAARALVGGPSATGKV
jgi:fatty-acyl-CoA synthase